MVYKKLAGIALAIAMIQGGSSAASAASAAVTVSVWTPTYVSAASVASGKIKFARVNDGGKMQISPCWRGKSNYLVGGLTITSTYTGSQTLKVKQIYPNPASKNIVITQERFVETSKGFSFSCPVVSNSAGLTSTSTSSIPNNRSSWWLEFSAADKQALGEGARFSVQVSDSSGKILQNRYINVPKLVNNVESHNQACAAAIFAGSIYMISGTAFRLGTSAVGIYGALTGNELASKAADGFSALTLIIDPPKNGSGESVVKVFDLTRKDGQKLSASELRTVANLNEELKSSSKQDSTTVLNKLRTKFSSAKYVTKLASTVTAGIDAVNAFDASLSANTWAIKQINSTCSW